MKKYLLAALFVALSATAFAERLSTDELAVRLGVEEWFSIRSTQGGQFHLSRLKEIYRADFQFTDASADRSQVKTGLAAYKMVLEPTTADLQKVEAKLGDDLSLSMNGATATTSFTYRPRGTYKDGRPVNCAARVNLTWERKSGLWQIAREDITPLAAQVPTEIATAK